MLKHTLFQKHVSINQHHASHQLIIFNDYRFSSFIYMSEMDIHGGMLSQFQFQRSLFLLVLNWLVLFLNL